MRDSSILTVIRVLHTVIYLVMVAAILVLLCAGATGYESQLVWVAVGLLAAETVVFVGNGLKCPLTELAVRYGATTGRVFDTFLPERATRYTFRFFGSLMVIGLTMLAMRLVEVIG